MEKRYGAPVAGPEKGVLGGFLDHYRQVLEDICSGVSDEDLRRPMVPSGTTLLGMIKHMAFVERGWFQENIAGEPSDLFYDENDPEMDFRIEPNESTAEVIEMYRASCEKSRSILEAVSLDDLVKGQQRSRDYNVRWVVVHMIEETARHAGHADILRELIDGKTETGYV